MAQNATMTSSSSSPAPTSTSSPVSSHWDKLRAELRIMVFEYVNLPAKLRIQVHHFMPDEQMEDDSSAEYAIEVMNKEEWRDMLRFQAIKEIDEAVLQPLFAAKKMTIQLEIVGHPNEAEKWEGNLEAFAPGLKFVQDWPAFLKKFPFRRMQTVAPYILRRLNPAERLRDLTTEEVHYLQPTYDQVKPEAWQEEDPNLTNPWAVTQSQWTKAQDNDMPDHQAIATYNAVERGLLVVAQQFFQLGLSAEDMGRLQERLAAMPSKINTRDFQLSSWTAGLMYASGLMGGYFGTFRSGRQSPVVLLEDVV